MEHDAGSAHSRLSSHLFIGESRLICPILCRDFLAANYSELKKANPSFPILVSVRIFCPHFLRLCLIFIFLVPATAAAVSPGHVAKCLRDQYSVLPALTK